MYEDITLTCKECGQEFVFTAGEQEFYAEKGFQNQPKMCKACRAAKKSAGQARMQAVNPRKCSQLFALTAVRKQKFRSSPATTDLFTAVLATLQCASSKFA